MSVRFKMTNKGELAILPRKDYEALAAKAQEADEDFATARLVARARKEIVAAAYSERSCRQNFSWRKCTACASAMAR